MNVIAFLKSLKEQLAKEAALRRYIDKDVPLQPDAPYPAEFPPFGNIQQRNQGIAAPQPTKPTVAPIANPAKATVPAIPAVQPKAHIPSFSLTPMQQKIADSLEQIFNFRLNEARQEEGELVGPKVHALAIKFKQDMEKKITLSPPVARQDTRVALDYVMDKILNDGSDNKEEILAELEEKYLAMTNEARAANGGAYDVEALNNHFIKIYSNNEKFAPYIREFLQNIQSKILPQEQAPTMIDEGHENLTEQEIRGLIFLNGATATGALTEIRDNANNSHLFSEIMNEARDKRGIDRQSMALMFESAYLNFDLNDKKSLLRYYKLFVNNSSKVSPAEVYKIISKGLKGSSDSMTSRLENSDIPNFISNVLFNPDDYGKENFIKYFLDRDKSALLNILQQEGATPEELSEINNIKKEVTNDSGKTKKRGKNTEQIQNICIKHVKPISQYVMQLMKSQDEGFFDWACQEAWRWTGRTQNKERQGAQVKNDDGSMSSFDYEDTKGGQWSDGSWSEEQGDLMDDQNAIEGEFGGEELDTNQNNAFGEDLASNNVFELEGLQGDRNVVDMNGVVRPAKLKSFFGNYKKLKSLYEDIKQTMNSKYEEAKAELPTNPKKSKTMMFNMLQKSLLYDRIFSSSSNLMNNLFMKASDGKDIQIGDERLKNILNQDWDSLFKQEDWARFDWSMNDPEIQALITKGVQDGLGTPESVYKFVVGKAYSANGEVNKNNIQRKMDAGMESMQEIYLDPSVVAKHGKASIISFIDLTGFRKNIAALGSLLAQTNNATYDDKIEYLTELVRKGAITNLGEEEIENMPIRQVAEVFGGVKRQLQALYGTSEDQIDILEDPSNLYISDQDIAQITASMGVPNITSKEAYRQLPKSTKADIAKKLYSSPKFQKFKLFVDRNETGLRKMLRYYMEQKSGQDQGFLQSVGASSEDDVYSMPRRRVLQIAKQFFPQLYNAYSTGQMKNTEVYKVLAKADGAKTEALANEVLGDFFNKMNAVQQEQPTENEPEEGDLPDGDGGEDKEGGRTTFYNQALAFAKILDMQSGNRIAASASFPVLRKIAAQKRMNALTLLKYRFAQRNVDTSVLDEAILRLIANDRRR